MSADEDAHSQQPTPDKLGLEGFRQGPPERGLSLDQLTAAFAEMLTSGDDPYRPAPPSAETVPAVVEEDWFDASAATADSATEECEISPRTILEAMFFVGGPGSEPLLAQQVARLMRGVRPTEIDALVRELNQQYAARRCPYEIVSEGAGYRLALREEHAAIREKFYGRMRQARLSQAAIEVLAIVAYNQPLTAEEVHRLRGGASSHLLRQLVRRQLLRLERGDAGSRRRQYYTTPRFLGLLGLSSLDDLPRGEDFEQR